MNAEQMIQVLSDHPSLQERTYQTLRGAIVEGQLAPGVRIYETSLAKRLGVSRNPVREAIRRLQQDGFIEVRPRNGIYVAEYGVDEVRDLYQIRAALEGTAASLAAQRMTDDELAGLDTVLERMERATARHAKHATVREADSFHQTIHQGARSPRLVAILDQLYGQIAHFRKITLAIPGRASQASEGHHHLVEVLRRRDAEEADRMMRQHVLSAVDAFMELAATAGESSAAELA
jgi:DNA-binding GntR family transcriptional regulator